MTEAVFSLFPASTSSWIVVYDPVTDFDSPGAKSPTETMTIPAMASSNVTSLRVTLPVLVALSVYVITSSLESKLATSATFAKAIDGV